MKIDFLPINESIVLTSSNHYASSAAYFNKVGLYFCLCLIYKKYFRIKCGRAYCLFWNAGEV